MPSLMADYASSAIQHAIAFLNDQGPLGLLARASLHRGATLYTHWPEQRALFTRGSLLCRLTTFATRCQLILPACTPTWGSNPLADSIIAHVTAALPPVGSNIKPSYPPLSTTLRILTPLWPAGIHQWADILHITATPSGPQPATTPSTSTRTPNSSYPTRT